MKRAVQLGAGGIGRGFLGQLFSEAGLEVVFVDVSHELVDELNSRGSYPLRLVGPRRHELLSIGPVRAIHAADREAVQQALAEAEIACTAVGVKALPTVVPMLAEGQNRRGQPLNVILCENQYRCSDWVRSLLSNTSPDFRGEQLGLVEAVVGRMVPLPDPERLDSLEVSAEDYSVLPVDAAAVVGSLPAIPGIRPVPDFSLYVERKLYLHNMSHAATAYLGIRRGHRFVSEAIRDDWVRTQVEEALNEICVALSRIRAVELSELRRESEALLVRFANPGLRDTLLRVGRDPLRKLRPTDRLVGAALLCLDAGVPPQTIGRAAAAAFVFSDELHPPLSGLPLRPETVAAVTGQPPTSELVEWILVGGDRLMLDAET